MQSPLLAAILAAVLLGGCARPGADESKTTAPTAEGLVPVGGGSQEPNATVDVGPPVPFNATASITVQGYQGANGYASTSANCLPLRAGGRILSGTVRVDWTPESPAAEAFQATVREGEDGAGDVAGQGSGGPGFEAAFDSEATALAVVLRPSPGTLPLGASFGQSLDVTVSGLADPGAAPTFAGPGFC